MTAEKSAEKSTFQRRRGRPTGSIRPPAAAASSEARRQAAAILEVLAGMRTPADAAGVLGVSLARYYLWEQRALAGLLAACEPRPRGPGPRATAEAQLASLQKQVARLQRDCARQQALLRVSQRAVGLPSAEARKPAAKKPGSRSRRRRPTVRALKAAAALAAASSSRQELGALQPKASGDAPIANPPSVTVQ